MAVLQLVNPRKRRRSGVKRKASASGTRRRPRRVRRAANPITTVRRRIRRSAGSIRRAPRRITRRRRNPISMRSLSGGSVMNIIKKAAVGGAGAVGFNMLFARILPMLPPSLQTGYAMQAVRAAITVAVGKFASKPTKGLSEQMAAGALIVQAAEMIGPIVAGMVPGTPAAAAAVNGIGYASANMVSRTGYRVPALQGRGVGAYADTRSPVLRGMGMYAQTNSPIVRAR